MINMSNFSDPSLLQNNNCCDDDDDDDEYIYLCMSREYPGK